MCISLMFALIRVKPILKNVFRDVYSNEVIKVHSGSLSNLYLHSYFLFAILFEKTRVTQIAQDLPVNNISWVFQ